MSQGRVIIYALADPRKPALIRYVGKTKNSLPNRYRIHLSSTHRWKCPKNDWIISLRKQGLTPRMWPIEICERSNWEERERFWIRLFKLLPGNLNVSDGGNGGPDMTGYHHSEETKRRIAEAGRGRKRSPEAIAKGVAKLRGFKHSLETRKKISEIQKGKKNSEASKIKLSKTLRAFYSTPAGQASIKAKRPPTLTDKLLEYRKSRTKPVMRLSDQKIYPSLHEAAAAVGAKRQSIYSSIHFGWLAAGCQWSFV